MPRTAKKAAPVVQPVTQMKPRRRSTKVVSIKGSQVTAAERKLRDFVAHLPAEFIECRQYNHAWTGHTVETGRDRYTVTLRCLRCKSYAREILSRDGSREGKRSIQYVEGYLAVGMGRMTPQVRAAVRLESVHRQVG